jgi:hypothetical protein
VDAGGFPDAFSTRCGSEEESRNGGGAGGFGAGISAIHRPRSLFIVEGEVRASMMPVGFGCDLLLRIVEVAPGIYETRPGFGPVPGTPGMPMLRTLFRAGLETPRDVVPIFRATVGAGVIWNGRPAPLGSFAVAVSSSNPGVRFYGELEKDITRIRETETRNRFHADSTGETAVETSVVSAVFHPTWLTLHLGIEMAIH